MFPPNTGRGCPCFNACSPISATSSRSPRASARSPRTLPTSSRWTSIWICQRSCCSMKSARERTPSKAARSASQSSTISASAVFGFDPESFAPTYKLIYGSPGRSLAIEIAKRLGMPASVIAAARENLTEEQKQLADHLARVDKDLRALEQQRREVSQQRAAIAESEKKLRGREESIREREETFS